jgi:hypothetical protein
MNFQFSIFNFQKLTITERIFVTAGVLMILSVPFLSIGQFYLWLAVKLIYLLAISRILKQKI